MTHEILQSALKRARLESAFKRIVFSSGIPDTKVIFVSLTTSGRALGFRSNFILNKFLDIKNHYIFNRPYSFKDETAQHNCLFYTRYSVERFYPI